MMKTTRNYSLMFVILSATVWSTTLLLPQVTAFSSGRSSQNQIDLRSSNEDIARNFDGPDLSGITSVDDAMKAVQAFIIQISEDFAEDMTKQCHARRVAIDYEGVKTDLINCLTRTIEVVSAKAMEIGTSYTLRKTEFEREMVSLQQTLQLEQKLTDRQKQFLTQNLFRPACGAIGPAMTECDDPKYTILTQASICKPDAEKVAEEYFRTAMKDLCRNDGAWILDFLEANPYKCSAEFQRAARGAEFKECETYFDKYKVDKNRPGQAKRLDTVLEFCNVTGKFGDCTRNLFIDSCKENPKPGQVLLRTFKDTRNFWSEKCGASVIVFFWPLLVFCFLTLVPNWTKTWF